MDNKIGEKIALARKEKGLTQKELGDKLFVTDKAVSKWERGLSLPDISLFDKLSKVLDIDMYSLIGLENDSNDYKMKKQFRKRLIIIFIFVLIIVFMFLFKMVSFGYVTEHFRYSNKLINLGGIKLWEITKRI